MYDPMILQNVRIVAGCVFSLWREGRMTIAMRFDLLPSTHPKHTAVVCQLWWTAEEAHVVCGAEKSHKPKLAVYDQLHPRPLVE